MKRIEVKKLIPYVSIMLMCMSVSACGQSATSAEVTAEETTIGIHPVNVIRTMFKIATETEDNIYAICTKPYCDDCFGIMHRGRLQRQGFENYTYHRPYHHIQRDKKLRNRNLKRQLSRKLSISSENVNKSEGKYSSSFKKKFNEAFSIEISI